LEEAIQRLKKEKEKMILKAKNIAPLDISQAILKLKEAKVESNNTESHYYAYDMPILKLVGSNQNKDLKHDNLKKSFYGSNFYINMNEKEEKHVKFINDASKINSVYNSSNYLTNIEIYKKDIHNQNLSKRGESHSLQKKKLKKITNDKLIQLDKKAQNSYLLYNVNLQKKKHITNK